MVDPILYPLPLKTHLEGIDRSILSMLFLRGKMTHDFECLLRFFYLTVNRIELGKHG